MVLRVGLGDIHHPPYARKDHLTYWLVSYSMWFVAYIYNPYNTEGNFRDHMNITSYFAHVLCATIPKKYICSYLYVYTWEYSGVYNHQDWICYLICHRELLGYHGIYHRVSGS